MELNTINGGWYISEELYSEIEDLLLKTNSSKDKQLNEEFLKLLETFYE